MKHLTVPLDHDHDRAVRALADEIAAVVGVQPSLSPAQPHMTLLAFTGLSGPAVRNAVSAALRPSRVFTMRAHGYGVWAGSGPFGPSLHVPVVRDAELDALHHTLQRAMSQAGAEIARWTLPELWSPHITIIAPVLDPDEMGQAVAHLLERHHPSWHIPVDRVQIMAGRGQPDEDAEMVCLGS